MPSVHFSAPLRALIDSSLPDIDPGEAVKLVDAACASGACSDTLIGIVADYADRFSPASRGVFEASALAAKAGDGPVG